MTELKNRSLVLPQGYTCRTWLLVFLVAFSGGCENQPKPTVAPSQSAKPVGVQIDFNGRGANKQFPIPWTDGLTAFGCLQQLEREAKITLRSKGSGTQTLLTAIDGLENRWAAGDNWIFTVNGKLGDRSSAVFELSPGDQLVWRFGKYEPATGKQDP